MTLTSFFRIFLAGVIAASVTGCSYIAKSILAPQKDISKFYLFTPTADTAAPATGTSQSTNGNFVLGLGPIKLPPYLDRPEVVTRAAPNRLELSKEDRWGESIQNGFTSAMQRNLAAQTGAVVIVFPWYSTVHIDMQVQIDIYRFETDSQGTATLSAKWTILDTTGKEHSVHGRGPSHATLETRRQHRIRCRPEPHNRRPKRANREYAAAVKVASGSASSLNRSPQELRHSVILSRCGEESRRTFLRPALAWSTRYARDPSLRSG